MLRITILLAVSVAIVVLSWRSLADFRSHGFYRFFGFELLAALILLNAPVWFTDPLALRQIVSWILGSGSVALAIEGFRLLNAMGRPSATAGLSTDLRGFDRTTTLVAAGAYWFIRHPLYGPLLALVWCAYLKNPSALPSVALALGATGFLIATSMRAERENLNRFGASYAAYMKRTWRFLPFIF